MNSSPNKTSAYFLKCLLLCAFVLFIIKAVTRPLPLPDEVRELLVKKSQAVSEWRITEQVSKRLDYAEVPLTYKIALWARLSPKKTIGLETTFRDRREDYKLSNGKDSVVIAIEIMDDKVVSCLILSNTDNSRGARLWKHILAEEWSGLPISIKVESIKNGQTNGI